MKATELMLRCYAIRRDALWSAICIDLCLAAQGASFEEARRKLAEQIAEYVTEAVTIDQEHAGYLLRRKAPLSQRLTWQLLRAGAALHALGKASARLFTQPLSLVPAPAC
jgi:predicted RNase H-like HicB family nuclease